MTQIAALLAGISVAALIFAATFWSAAQVYRQTGRLRLAHGAALALTVIAMAALSSALWALSQVAGLLLIPAALVALVMERGANRLLPLIHVLFGAALLAGLPFGG